MFTGIIKATVPIVGATKQGTCLRVRIKKPAKWRLTLGQSISIDGICSTVVTSGKTFFDVEYMPETLSKTTAGIFAKDDPVNLERSLALGDALDGNIVQGHVDACGEVMGTDDQGESRLMQISLSQPLRKYVASQGSIVVNGVSLTVASVGKGVFTVALIPYTLKHTNLGKLKRGDSVNIEVDVLARYVVQALETNRLTVQKNAKKK